MEYNIVPFDNKYRFYFENDVYQLPADIRKIVDENWQKMVELDVDNLNLFNGEVICLKEIIERDGYIDFIFNVSDYAHFLVARKNLIPQKYKLKISYSSALVLTADNYIAFAKSGGKSFKPGRYQFVGGVIDYNFLNGSEIDFTKCIKQEFIEELGLDIDDKKYVDSYKKLYVSTTNPSVIFLVKLNFNSTQLVELLAEHNQVVLKEKGILEIADFIFVDKSSYKDVLAKLSENTTSEISYNLRPVLDAYFND